MNIGRMSARRTVRVLYGRGLGGYVIARVVVPYHVRRRVNPDAERAPLAERVFTFVLACVVVAGWGFGWWSFFAGLGVLAGGGIVGGVFFAALPRKSAQ